MEAMYVVVGGGIAGVTCAETLAFLEPEKSIILISESSLIKTAINLQALTRTLTSFDVEEQESQALSDKYENLTVIHDKLKKIDHQNNTIITNSDQEIKYNYLSICTGAQPKLIPQSESIPEIVGIRDTDSVEIFLDKLKDSKKIIIVGNGGIASELVYKIRNTEVHWVVKDKHITATFVDPGAAEFFQNKLKTTDKTMDKLIYKRMRYNEDNTSKSGAALGPDWYKNLIISGAGDPQTLKIHYQTEIEDVEKIDKSLKVILTNGEKIECDLIVSATGVNPKLNFQHNLELSQENGILVNEFMQTSIPNIYAAGDVCAANWTIAKHWFQMRLWTQARQMGCYAAKCMSMHSKNEMPIQDFCFEMFAHSTKLFGYKVILLGLYNGQKLGQDYEIFLRTTKGDEYIKFVLENHRLQGAVLIGDTDLEETCENLILNQLDLSPYGDDILNPNIDIEDYFD